MILKRIKISEPVTTQVEGVSFCEALLHFELHPYNKAKGKRKVNSNNFDGSTVQSNLVLFFTHVKGQLVLSKN
jgi:hypothetical protein